MKSCGWVVEGMDVLGSVGDTEGFSILVKVVGEVVDAEGHSVLVEVFGWGSEHGGLLSPCGGGVGEAGCPVGSFKKNLNR